MFYGTFAFYKHPKEPDYGAYPIHAATGDDATGTIKVASGRYACKLCSLPLAGLLRMCLAAAAATSAS